MKRSALPFIFLSALALTACGGNAPSSQGSAAPAPLTSEEGQGYDLDGNVDNSNGSLSYEIFVRSFYDSNGDGIGDLNGVKAKIPYLKSLGVKTVWLMPIHPSPTYHGYDVSDYYGVHPNYGTIDDFDSLVATARANGIDIMLDMVLNHSSTQCSWFSESAQDYASGGAGQGGKADWYVWSDTPKAGFSRHSNGYYYESEFDSSMPDFNWDSPAMREELDNIFKFWIQDHGVKGFRLDAVKYYYYTRITENIAIMDFFMETARKYDADFYMVGEDWEAKSQIIQYHESKVQSFFNFFCAVGGADYQTALLGTAKGNNIASRFCSAIETFEGKIKAKNPEAYSSYFLSNHDQDRSSGFLREDIDQKMGFSLYGLLPGTPWIYYGEEIGMKGTRITSPEDYSDVRRRLPMVWSQNNKTGECHFPETNRQDLNNNAQVTLGVEDRLAEPDSVLNHYRKVAEVRNKYPVFKNGVFTSLVNQLNAGEDETHVFAYKIQDGEDYVIVVTNLEANEVEVTSPGTEILDSISATHLVPQLNGTSLRLGPKSTVIMR